MPRQLFLTNSQTQKKEEFIPHQAPQVKMYCCGPTVYDFLHIGNFRGAIFYNLLRNYLEHIGYQVTYVYNYTDVDDKILARAQSEGVSSAEISERFIKEFEHDYKRLGLRPHSANPKVTDYIEPIKNMIATLVAKGSAYEVKGEVLFAVRQFSEYGKLSHRNPDDMRTGTRIEAGAYKKDPLDFSLWKPAKAGEDAAWPSPWGLGRPGWHIECSAMTQAILGDQIDIHGGGMDLIFPHHENEIAQSEACSGHTYVKYWVHNNMIDFSGTKMSKSLGNVITGRSFMEEYDPEVLKFLYLSSHYRSVLDLNDNTIQQAIKGLARVYSALSVAESYLGKAHEQKEKKSWPTDGEWEQHFSAEWEKIEKSLCDDMSTPEVFAVLFEAVRFFNAKVKRGAPLADKIKNQSGSFAKFINKFGELSALFAQPPAEFLRKMDRMLLKKMNITEDEIEQLVKARVEARLQKDFSKSDDLRKKLSEAGVSVMDFAGGSFWEVTK